MFTFDKLSKRPRLFQRMTGLTIEEFIVTCPELDLAVDLAEQIDNTVAARMTGGGFGGCTVNLVKKSEAKNLAEELAKRYKKITGLTPKYYICQADDGVKEIKG